MSDQLSSPKGDPTVLQPKRAKVVSALKRTTPSTIKGPPSKKVSFDPKPPVNIVPSGLIKPVPAPKSVPVSKPAAKVPKHVIDFFDKKVFPNPPGVKQLVLKSPDTVELPPLAAPPCG